MFKTYFIIAFRNFIRNKIFSLINVLGLSIGISSALVIFLIVRYDFSFDHFEKDSNQIYRVVTNMSFAGNPMFVSGVPSPLPSAVKKEVSGIEETVGFHQFNGNGKVNVRKKNGDKPLQINHQTDIVFADPAYFNLIPFQWLAGGPEISLAEPFKTVLTESRAKTYFPSMPYPDMIGKQIVYDDSIVTTVSGIVKDLGKNTDFIFKEFISQSTIPATGLKENYSWTDWNSINGGSQLFIKLAPKSSVKNVEARLQILLKKNDKGANEHNTTTTYKLQPFSELHFNSDYGGFGDHIAHKPTLYGLLTVAAFLLILGCINFINLTTAQASQRAKEIGVRKTMGGSGNQLMMQFLSETLFITIISMLISIVITPLLLKVFADFIPKDLHFDLLHQPDLLAILILLTLVVTVLAGFYPAMVLSKFKPVLILKNQAFSGTAHSRKAWLRKGLTISQFLIAQVFCMATLVTVKQINYVLNKDMGFKKDAIITVYTPFIWNRLVKPDNKRFVLLDEIKQMPGIQMASLGNDAPSASGWSSDNMKFKDGKKEIVTDVRQKFGDANFLKLYQIHILAGRNIKPSDTSNEFLVNETYMHILGFQKPTEVLNKQINNMPIVGVMADFNQESLHATIKPLVFSSNLSTCFNIHIGLKPQAAGRSWKTSIAAIEKAFKKIYPEEDFNYAFLDESIASFYKSEQNISRLLTWATGLAIFISCMGLLGLVMYTTNLRTKEIGVRKVLGASVGHIVSILSKDFIRLVLIASLIAIPLTWWATNKWLENFAYKTPVKWWVFLLNTLFMMFIALITLSIQTIRAASANPVNSLRSE
jgi:ABC-type antimicrobial peptide transport system permease subunit